jgi:hypothetical protein
MTWEHERVEELMAAYALDGLESEDVELAERALAEHVLECPRCRSSLESYRALAGDLALLATPVEPPDTVAARLRRSTERRPPTRIFRTGWGVAAVATAAALLLAGWNVALSTRLGDTEAQQGLMADAFTAFARGEGGVPLRGATPARVTMISDPAQGHLYLIATRLPEVDGVYTVWLLGNGRTWSPGTLEPTAGADMMDVETDPERWDVIMVTVEPGPERPSPAPSPLMSAPVQTS